MEGIFLGGGQYPIRRYVVAKSERQERKIRSCQGKVFFLRNIPLLLEL